MSIKCSTPIENLMLWRMNRWMKYEMRSEHLILQIHCNQLLIISGSKVLESINMINNKIKGIFKNDIVILFIALSGKEVRKIKFKFQQAGCLLKLGEHFPVMDYNNGSCIPSKYQNIENVLQRVLAATGKTPGDCTRVPMPIEYNNFIKICLLDPDFPQLVKETEKVLQELKK